MYENTHSDSEKLTIVKKEKKKRKGFQRHQVMEILPHEFLQILIYH